MSRDFRLGATLVSPFELLETKTIRSAETGDCVGWILSSCCGGRRIFFITLLTVCEKNFKKIEGSDLALLSKGERLKRFRF